MKFSSILVKNITLTSIAVIAILILVLNKSAEPNGLELLGKSFSKVEMESDGHFPSAGDRTTHIYENIGNNSTMLISINNSTSKVEVVEIYKHCRESEEAYNYFEEAVVYLVAKERYSLKDSYTTTMEFEKEGNKVRLEIVTTDGIWVFKTTMRCI